MVVFIVLAALDNMAIGLVPPLLSPISHELGVGEPAVAGAFSMSLLITAFAAVGWAYVGDRSDRKRLLMIGTLLWAAGVGVTGYVASFAGFFAAQAVAALGLGVVASVGFSVVGDLVSPRRRPGLSAAVVPGYGRGGWLQPIDRDRDRWVFSMVVMSGAVLSLVGGLVGDRWQRRIPGGRVMVASIGVLAAGSGSLPVLPHRVVTGRGQHGDEFLRRSIIIDRELLPGVVAGRVAAGVGAGTG